MDNKILLTAERGLWLKPGPWLAGNAKPTAWFVLPPPVGIIDRNRLQKNPEVLETGLTVEDVRIEYITEDVAQLTYRAQRRQAPSIVKYLCCSTYVKGRRSWSLVHHQRTRTGETEPV